MNDDQKYTFTVPKDLPAAEKGLWSALLATTWQLTALLQPSSHGAGSITQATGAYT